MEKKKWVKNVPLFIVEIVLLLICIGVLYFTMRITDEDAGVKKAEVKEENIVVNEAVKEKYEKAEETEEGEEAVEVPYTGVFNVAFFGVDARDESLGKGNRSDSIMVCSIDMDTHEVRLVSIYRDTYLNIGNDTYNKCNVAYAQGGPEQALGMINMNTDLYVTDYITVGFEGLMRAVDALGGVEMDVKEEEISHLNNYQISMVGTTTDNVHFEAKEGVDYIPVTKPGVQTLNGLQATAYCRIRYVGDDFARTQRQRNLLIAMMEKGKASSITTLTGALNAVLPYVQTSLDIEDVVSVLGMVGDFEVTLSDGFPFAGLRNGANIGTKGSCVVATSLEANARKLHELLYPDEAYEPSKELLSFSRQIEQETGELLLY